MKSYKAAPTNVKKNRVAGSFKNSGQKSSTKHEQAKAKLNNIDPVHAKLRKISKSMFARKRVTGDAAMRAQLNG